MGNPHPLLIILIGVGLSLITFLGVVVILVVFYIIFLVLIQPRFTPVRFDYDSDSRLALVDLSAGINHIDGKTRARLSSSWATITRFATLSWPWPLRHNVLQLLLGELPAE